MRITAGKNRGRKLQVPNTGLRPTTDKVRQALFNMLGPMYGRSFLDLYAGSGSVGLDALSRGAEKVVFVEQMAPACETIRGNLQLVNSGSSVICATVLSFLARTHNNQYDVIFLDPPYFSEQEKTELTQSKIVELLGTGGVLVYEASSRETNPLFENLVLHKERAYGESKLFFYIKE